MQKIGETEKSGWVYAIDRIVVRVLVQVGAASSEEQKVFGCPPSGERVIIPRSEAHQLRIKVVHAPGEPERLEAGVGVRKYVAELVVVHALGYLPVGRVHH